MNLTLYIARKISKNKSASFSKFIIRLATIATALSVAIMIIAVAIVQGFKHTIEDKMYVFWGGVQINLFSSNPGNMTGMQVFSYDKDLVDQIKKHPGVKSIHPYVIKPVIIKSEATLEGIQLKGIDKSYDFSTKKGIQFEGDKIDFTNPNYGQEIILSKTIANRLDKKIGDSLLITFFNPEQTTPSLRKLKLSGLYHTGMDEIDKSFGFADLRLLNKVSNNPPNDITGYQVELDDNSKDSILAKDIYQQYITPPLNTATVRNIYPQIQSWLDIQDMNTKIILIIMAIIAVINLSTGLLIYILERTAMIGTLKALGMHDGKISLIFLYHASIIALKGIIIGTIIGVVICVIQQYFQIIKLDEANYYMSAAPISLSVINVLLIDLGTLIFCTLIMTIPSLMVRKISIVKALKFK